MVRILAKWLIALFIAVVALVILALYVTPWPGVLVIRAIFDKGAAEASTALQKHVPGNIRKIEGLRYDPEDADALLDIYLPADDSYKSRSIIVWVHGGGWVSGRRSDLTNYLSVVAGRGFAVANIDYTIAPEATYPTPVQQVTKALQYLTSASASHGINQPSFILAGDSAGAQIAAQVANTITSPAYAEATGITPLVPASALRGAILFCGPYDAGAVNLDGPFGIFLRTVLWAYSGTRDFASDTSFAYLSVGKHVTPAFPPSFISAGSADPLEGQSRQLVEALVAQGVDVEQLFFDKHHQPPLAHEYQFNLDGKAGQQALEAMLKFALSHSP